MSCGCGGGCGRCPRGIHPGGADDPFAQAHHLDAERAIDPRVERAAITAVERRDAALDALLKDVAGRRLRKGPAHGLDEIAYRLADQQTRIARRRQNGSNTALGLDVVWRQ
jgi:hypothetical protein